jgi:hypothetical protein
MLHGAGRPRECAIKIEVLNSGRLKKVLAIQIARAVKVMYLRRM